MERKFEADTREEANRKADDWWAKAKGVRFIHRSQIPAALVPKDQAEDARAGFAASQRVSTPPARAGSK
jgi:hypothetical protein